MCTGGGRRVPNRRDDRLDYFRISGGGLNAKVATSQGGVHKQPDGRGLVLWDALVQALS
jgi:hypothetical protein